MLVKLVFLLFVVLAADASSLSGKCTYVTNPVEPDLEKLSGSWYVVSYRQEAPGSMLIEFKKDGAKVTLNENKSKTWFMPLETGVDKKNRKVLKIGDQKSAEFQTWYLVEAEYDNFVIIYFCDSAETGRETVFLLVRSKVVDEETRKKFKNVLQEYPGL